MPDFLLETHAHTSEVSRCARMPAAELVENYVSAGYDGVVITDHLSAGSVGRLTDGTWDEKIDYFLSGYGAARAAAERLGRGFVVLLGMELCFDRGENDYLVYGIDEAFLRRVGDLTKLDIRQLRRIADENGLLVFQAHPFRPDMSITDYRLLDGVEVYNGNSSHNSNNDVAVFWAEKHGLLKSSGSDFHGMWGMRPGGLYFPTPVRTNAELVAALRENRYRLK